ncbi:MAG: hypothetical protein IJW77_18515 [Clostridia bacterium]|nr:hypothetical protein [Clostridia bacterium]
MKRSVIFAQTALLLAALLISCGDSTKTAADTTSTVTTPVTEATETTVDDGRLPAPAIVDMNGAELRILNSTPESFNWATTTILVEEADGDILNDALFNRERTVEELYNCSIVEVPEANADMEKKIPNAVAAGDKYFDTAMLFDARVSTILLKDCLMSWDEIKSLDLSNPWWDNAATAEYNFGGIQAAVSGAYSLYNYSTRHVYVFNNKMMAELDVDDDIYEMVREGKWTVDEMYRLGEMAVSDLNGDGVMKETDDRYGIIGTPTRHYSALLMGSDVRYIDRDKDGALYFAIDGNEYAQSVMAKFVALDLANKDIFTNKLADINVDVDTVFTDGRAMFCAAYVGEAAKMRGLEFDIGFVPAPKFDEGQESYHSLVEGGAQSILPRMLDEDDLTRVGTILDAFAYYSYYESIPAYIDVLLMGKVARNEDSEEMLQLVFDTSAYDLGTGIWSADTKNKYVSTIFEVSKTDIASRTEKITSGIEKQLEKFMTALDDLS